MRVTESGVRGVLVFEPTPFTDARGSFTRTFDAKVARAVGIDPRAFVQDSVSRSSRGVVRGLHVRTGQGEAKLVRCSWGAIYDVVVDLRPDSPTRGHWTSIDLDGDSQRSVYIPAGCAHGFQALTEFADTTYRIDRDHDPSEDLSIAHDDSDLGIPWPLPVALMSESDRGALPLSQLDVELRRIRVETA